MVHWQPTLRAKNRRQTNVRPAGDTYCGFGIPKGFNNSAQSCEAGASPEGPTLGLRPADFINPERVASILCLRPRLALQSHALKGQPTPAPFEISNLQI